MAEMCLFFSALLFSLRSALCKCNDHWHTELKRTVFDIPSNLKRTVFDIGNTGKTEGFSCGLVYNVYSKTEDLHVTDFSKQRDGFSKTDGF